MCEVYIKITDNTLPPNEENTAAIMDIVRKALEMVSVHSNYELDLVEVHTHAAFVIS